MEIAFIVSVSDLELDWCNWRGVGNIFLNMAANVMCQSFILIAFSIPVDSILLIQKFTGGKFLIQLI
jgi:hypothetical protein